MSTRLLFLSTLLSIVLFGNELRGQSASKQLWTISGERSIRLNLEEPGTLPYSDTIEMAGRRVAGIISYTINEQGMLSIERDIFFPQLHEFKNDNDTWFHDYRAYLQDTYRDHLLPKLYINDEQFIPGPLNSVIINGTLNFEHKASKNGLALSRTFFPSTHDRQFIELWTVTNTSLKELRINSGNTLFKLEDFGAKGRLTRRIYSNAPETILLKAGESSTFSLIIEAKLDDESFSEEKESDILHKREVFLNSIASSLNLETPNPVLNTLFEFSKIRAAESIYESELGLIHSPGGGRYYVGIWANDQAEYINPFFPYLGYDLGHQSAMNAFRAFAKEMNPEYNPIRYSFEIEGLVKPFIKDRGDAAMIAYGAAHYAMASGNKEQAQELWPLIEWCLEYCDRHLNPEGVVMSESDEMEGRIETGTANLSTSSLYYGALNHAVDLGRSLNKKRSQLNNYRKKAKKLQAAIERYFGAEVEGLNTYKYYKEHEHLRHWICLPLVVGIHERKDATVEALFERLWTDNGVHVEKNSDNESISKIFWDRGTLYALRGTLFAGATE